MLKNKSKICCLILSLAMLISALAVTTVGASAASEHQLESAGWFESAYAEWAPVSGADGYNAYISTASSSSWTKLDSELIRSYGSYYRVDAVGLKAGEYKIKIVPTKNGAEQTSSAITTDTLKVEAYDRSGFAHFNYTEGVGAYNDDGTLKDNAIVLYVTNENKDTVSVTSKDGTTVKGIGNILNSVGQDVGGGKNSKGAIANTNADIIRKLAKDGTPLVIRIVGNVTAPEGLTAFDSDNYGGTKGDNGFMARMSGGKDITIEGIGFDATMNGWGIHFICQTADYTAGIGKSFEVRNISFKNVPEDCVGMEGQQNGSTLTAPVERCWIHHCSFYAPIISNPAESDKDGGDGACDFKRGQYFTNSYCYYDGYHKTNLVGSSDDSLQYHISYHHNYWKNCESRGPLARQADIHMYNNIFEGQSSYCMSLRANAYIFSEYNAFIKCKNVADDKTGGVCKAYNNSYMGCSFGSGTIYNVTDKSETVSSANKYANFDTNPALSYIPTGDYILQDNIADMKAVVMAYAGTQKEEIITPDQVNTSLIPASRYPTAAVTLDYSKSLNKTTVLSTSGTYDNIIFNVKKLANDCIVLGGATGFDIVFFVNTEVNISMTAIPKDDYLPVLYNELGQQIIYGTGSASNLPAGIYFIQSSIYDVGSGSYKEAKISGLTITAVDPNAVTKPLPTPPPVEDGNGGNDSGSGDSGDNGGNQQPGTDNGGNNGNVTVPVGSYVHNVTENGTTDPNGFFTLSGATSTSKGTVTFNELSLEKCLKVSSSAYITFTAPADGKVVLVFNSSCADYTLTINGTSGIAIPSDGIVVFEVAGGTSYTVKKDKSESFLYYLAYTPDSIAHTHNYSSEETVEVSCTENGLITYTCDCGDSYTETVDAIGHKYRDGECLNCGGIDPDFVVEDGDCTHTDEDGDGLCDNCGEAVENDDGCSGEIIDDDLITEPKLNFFQKIWRAIVEFFQRLFGKK